MRVLITTDAVGGVWTFTRELVSGLLEQGCDVCCVSFGRLPDTSQCLEMTDLQTNAKGHLEFHCSSAPLEWMADNGEAYSAGAQLLINQIDAWSPDILHLNQFCFGALPVSLPKVVTVHSDVLSWAHACAPGQQLQQPWLSCYREHVVNGIAGATLLTAPTRWMLKAFLQQFPAPAPVRIIPNGMDICSEVARTAQRKLQIATAGRFWDLGKGLQIVKQIRCEWPIVVAGECPAEENANERLTFTGALPAADLYRLFRESSVYLCTSIYEPFGLAPLEAALCGCAVVARDIPSLREVWGGAALYFSTADELEQLLQGLRHSPDRLRAAQQLSYAHARGYTRQRMTLGYLAAYSDAAEQQRAC